MTNDIDRQRQLALDLLAGCLDPVRPEAITACTTSPRVSALLGGLAESFPDASFTAEWVVTEGDRVALGGRFRGTHRGPWRGVPASGHRVEAAVAISLVLVDGLVEDMTVTTDSLAVAEQIGAVAPFGPKACQLR
jgi:predicted ester cyclase